MTAVSIESLVADIDRIAAKDDRPRKPRYLRQWFTVRWECVAGFRTQDRVRALDANEAIDAVIGAAGKDGTRVGNIIAVFDAKGAKVI